MSLFEPCHCTTCSFSLWPTKRAFDQRVTVCGSQKCDYVVVTFVWGLQRCVDLIAPEAKGPKPFKSQSHLLSTFNQAWPVTDIGSWLTGAHRLLVFQKELSLPGPKNKKAKNNSYTTLAVNLLNSREYVSWVFFFLPQATAVVYLVSKGICVLICPRTAFQL